MNLRCIDNRNKYALTVGTEYLVISDTKEMVRLVNDNGALQHYAKSLFEEVQGEVAQPVPVPVPVPIVPAVSTVQEVLDSIEMDYDEDDDYIDITMIIDGEEIKFSPDITNSESHASCGIREIEGINGVAYGVVENVPDRQNLRTQVLKSILEVIINAHDNAFVMLSTNTNNDHYPLINAVLEPLSSYTQTKRNPNSGNDITIWIIETGE